MFPGGDKFQVEEIDKSLQTVSFAYLRNLNGALTWAGPLPTCSQKLKPIINKFLTLRSDITGSNEFGYSS